jgi:diaminohydroxyphosphoribosylaminopyrimidine deaminase/5-amino-6-(5-phosphoribosylamino)uracil reductase
MIDDAHWMSLALTEARKGIGKTAPNPPVGSVIVKDGILLGKGWHRKAGTPHAERMALADARERHGEATIRGASAYVTLEPCSTHGRTPPCVQGLIEAGIREVIYACEDPNPAHAGRADQILTENQIAVRKNILREEAEAILRPFAKVQRTGLPWVILKTAMSLDGRITRPAGESSWLTSEEARLDVQHLRSEVDMILTSGETVRRDHPALTIRVPDLCEGREQPWRLVISQHPDTLPITAPLFADVWKHRTLVRGGDLTQILRTCAIELGILSVLVEAGGKLAAELLQHNLVDEVVTYLAPIITGGLPAVAGEKTQPLKLKNIVWSQLGPDVKFRGLI